MMNYFLICLFELIYIPVSASFGLIVHPTEREGIQKNWVMPISFWYNPPFLHAQCIAPIHGTLLKVSSKGLGLMVDWTQHPWINRLVLYHYTRQQSASEWLLRILLTRIGAWLWRISFSPSNIAASQAEFSWLTIYTILTLMLLFISY